MPSMFYMLCHILTLRCSLRIWALTKSDKWEQALQIFNYCKAWCHERWLCHQFQCRQDRSPMNPTASEQLFKGCVVRINVARCREVRVWMHPSLPALQNVKPVLFVRMCGLSTWRVTNEWPARHSIPLVDLQQLAKPSSKCSGLAHPYLICGKQKCFVPNYCRNIIWFLRSLTFFCNYWGTMAISASLLQMIIKSASA